MIRTSNHTPLIIILENSLLFIFHWSNKTILVHYNIKMFGRIKGCVSFFELLRYITKLFLSGNKAPARKEFIEFGAKVPVSQHVVFLFEYFL